MYKLDFLRVEFEGDYLNCYLSRLQVSAGRFRLAPLRIENIGCVHMGGCFREPT